MADSARDSPRIAPLYDKDRDQTRSDSLPCDYEDNFELSTSLRTMPRKNRADESMEDLGMLAQTQNNSGLDR